MRHLFFGFLLLSTSLFAQRDSVINRIKCHLVSENADTGTVWVQQKIVKKGVTKFNGVCFEVYPGGKLKAKGYYKRGKRTGKWLRYYRSGQKTEEGYFDAGYKSDLWMMYYESGKLSWKGNFYKNMRSGFWRYFYEDGQPKAMTRYRVRTESIAKKAKGDKKAKKGMSVSVNREIKYSISPADSLVEYYPDGKLRTRILYGKEGELNGRYETYYENGAKAVSGHYINGAASGTWNYYCESGTLFVSYGSPLPVVQMSDDPSCQFGKISPWIKWETEYITL